MVRRLATLLVAAALGGTAIAGTVTAAAAAPTTAAVDYTAILALSNCSGSLIRVPGASDDDPALALTNGHCSEYGMPGAGEVNVNQSSRRRFTLLDPSGKSSLGTLRANEILYNTMTDTDVTLYRLTQTYAQIQSEYGITALTLSTAHPVQGTDIDVVSGYWKETWSCAIDGFAYEVKEADWTWQDSVRYTSACDVIGGTSGSPVIDPATDQVIAINNTINENGESCTLDNPCEVDQDGNVTVHEGIGYAQETYILANCIGAGSVVNLDDANCQLPKP
jgi:V8-like Glu-specific endopeptidase